MGGLSSHDKKFLKLSGHGGHKYSIGSRRSHSHKTHTITTPNWKTIGSQRNTSAYMVEYLDDDSEINSHHKHKKQQITVNDTKRQRHKRQRHEKTRNFEEMKTVKRSIRNLKTCPKCEDREKMYKRRNHRNISGNICSQTSLNNSYNQSMQNRDIHRKRYSNNTQMMKLNQNLGHTTYDEKNSFCNNMNNKKNMWRKKENISKEFPASKTFHPFVQDSLVSLYNQLDFDKVGSDYEDHAFSRREIEVKHHKPQPKTIIHDEPLLNMDNINELIEKLDIGDLDVPGTKVDVDDELDVFEQLLDDINDETIDFGELHELVSEPDNLDKFVKRRAIKVKSQKKDNEIDIRMNSCRGFKNFPM